MTKNKWVTLGLSSAVILAVMAYGVSQAHTLPAQLVTHWGVDNQPNGWMPKTFFIYGLPLIMLAAQWVLTFSTAWASRRGTHAPRMERVMTWIIPIVTVVMYVVTIRYGQGHPVNVRFWAIAVVGAIFILMGNYLPTVPAAAAHQGWSGFGYHVPWQVNNPAGALKTMRVLGQVMVIGGLLMLASLVFPPVGSVVALAVVMVAIFGVLLLSYRWTTRTPSK